MCVVCFAYYKNDQSSLQSMEDLDCSYCRFVTEIPYMKNLKVLRCYDCPKLEKISTSPQLEHIDCSNSENLQDIPDCKKLKYLYMENCKKVKTLPLIDELCILVCPYTNLYTIPNYKKLTKLTISFCNNLIEVPKVNKCAIYMGYNPLLYIPINLRGSEYHTRFKEYELKSKLCGRRIKRWARQSRINIIRRNAMKTFLKTSLLKDLITIVSKFV